MRITVLGCGAIGQLWLAKLHIKGHAVQGWLRVPQPYCNIHLIDEKGEIFNRSLVSNNLHFLSKSDLLLVTLKAWQVSYAVNAIATFLPEKSPILLLHNGMGTISELKNIRQPLLMATTTHAAQRNNNIVLHISSGITHIGPIFRKNSNYSYLAGILQQALPDVIWHDNIFPQLLQKLAVSCIINPLTAILNCQNGRLKYFSETLAILCAELSVVLEYEGFHISKNDLLYYVEQVINNTARNISSMLQDIRAKRHTEIDYITGYLLNRARLHGISVPENTLLYNKIKSKESKYECLSSSLSC